jgi:hypothetical protein
VTVCTHLSTPEVCSLLGITFRQMDHVSRTVLQDVPGSGNHRRWDDDTVDRLTVAKALLDAIQFAAPKQHSPWPILVDAVMASRPPVPGWVTATPDGAVVYYGWVAPYGESGICTRWRPVRRGPA